jgi:hypothetical protein|mmetsp:Transcript_23368/g.39331  ORF Transcript_23368/g.39331 Transcript_23368/m.39331 type:complete len:255 (+) Transcript_23368:353-1117(+)
MQKRHNQQWSTSYQQHLLIGCSCSLASTSFWPVHVALPPPVRAPWRVPNSKMCHSHVPPSEPVPAVPQTALTKKAPPPDVSSTLFVPPDMSKLKMVLVVVPHVYTGPAPKCNQTEMRNKPQKMREKQASFQFHDLGVTEYEACQRWQGSVRQWCRNYEQWVRRSTLTPPNCPHHTPLESHTACRPASTNTTKCVQQGAPFGRPHFLFLCIKDHPQGPLWSPVYPPTAVGSHPTAIGYPPTAEQLSVTGFFLFCS